MKILLSLYATLFFVIATCEPPASKPLVFPNWPPKTSNQIKSQNHSTGKGQRTLVVQIRGDKRIPFVIKRSPHHQTGLPSLNQPNNILSRPIRPIKLSISPHFMKASHLLAKHNIRKPMLKLKIQSSTKLQGFPEKPYIYEKPSFSPAAEFQKLPIKNPVQFSDNHFVPIHTVAAPNLGIHDNQIQHEEFLYTPPSAATPNFNPHQYQVTEDHTNDQTIIDLVSGQQKYFAPDPDPSLPTAKIRPATESFNTPSNGKPFPSDIQNNYLPASNAPQHQALVQHFPSTSGNHFPNEIYGLPITNQPQLQQFILQQASANTPLSVHNPTYLVTQSKNLYNQHQQQKQQQLFKPNPITAYGPDDLTQEVASDGQILQSAKDHKNQIHPEFHSSDIPAFAALIGGPPTVRLNHEPSSTAASEGGFIVSNFFGNTNQNLNAYQEYLELSQRQRENDRTLEQANLELQKKLLEQDAPNPQPPEPSVSAYEEHQRLLKQHLGASPLRIFVPDEDYQAESRSSLQKRSDGKIEEAELEDVEDEDNIDDDDEIYDLQDNSQEDNIHQKDDKKST